jgi:hypothetical protein
MAALVVLTGTLPKASEAVDSTVAATPVPLSDTVCGLLEALSEMLSVPVCTPRAVGAKSTRIVQLAPTATVLEVLHVPPGTTLKPAVVVIEEMFSPPGT